MHIQMFPKFDFCSACYQVEAIRDMYELTNGKGAFTYIEVHTYCHLIK